MGCRCEECANAKAADTWARARVNKWEASLRVKADDCILSSGASVPSLFIEQVIKENENQIKVDVLTEIRHELKNTDNGFDSF